MNIRSVWLACGEERRLSRGRKVVRSCVLVVLALSVVFSSSQMRGVAAGDEYTGKFEPQLAPNTDDLEQAIFKPGPVPASLKLPEPIEGDATVTSGLLYNALADKATLTAILVEPADDDPYLYADVDSNRVIDKNERFDFVPSESQILQTTVAEPLKEGPFQSFPLFVEYYKNTRTDEMKPGERLLLYSKAAFARGTVDIAGKPTLVEYEYNAHSRKVNPRKGKLGLDSNGDGVIDLDPFSPEIADAEDEDVVFRAGSTFVSTKRADLEKNVIVLRAHPASDYRRIELAVGAAMPDFEFADFGGKKHRLSDFRGKFLLIDFWGMWCPACRAELPYLGAAYKRFRDRSFDILGMDTDEPGVQMQVGNILKKNGLTWTQARLDSITTVIRDLRIHSFPTTLLLDQEGKVVSLDNVSQGQADLRGKDLLKSLDEILPR